MSLLKVLSRIRVPIGIRSLFCVLVLLAGPVPATSAGGAMAPGSHDAHAAGSADPQMGEMAGGEDHHIHLHPSAEESADVGLEEKLGATIPLGARFIDETGRPVFLRDLVSMPTIIAPVYYHCPNVCNFLQGGLARVLPGIKLEPGKDFRVLSISFDETETPAEARKSKALYMDAMNGRFPADAWTFLTGEKKEILRVTDAAGYHFKRQGPDFMHPVALIVVSPQGKIIRYLHGTSVLPMDLTLALVEASEERIGATIRKVAQFCFSYDPENNRYVFNLFRVSATAILLTAGAFLAFLILRGRKPPVNKR